MPATEQESKKQLAAREALDIINDISNLLVGALRPAHALL
jgi:hypothetical protein